MARRGRGRAVNDRAIEKWMALELGGLQRALVAAPRPLADLVLEEVPSAPTRSGEPHRFDKPTLRRAHDALGPLARRRLRVPFTFYVDKETPDDAYLVDEAALELLRALGEVPAESAMREGRYWLGHARARAVASRLPTLAQFSML